MKNLFAKIIRTNDKTTEYLLNDTFTEKHPIVSTLFGFVLVASAVLYGLL